MKSKRLLISCGLLAALIGLLTLVPARVGYHAFLKAHVPVAGIEGTLWHGTAAEASIDGIYLRDIEWRMRPLAIFTGKLSYAVSASSVSGVVESQVVIGSSGDINLSQVTAAVPLYPFAGSLGLPGLSGVAQLRFTRLDISNGLATAADGTLDLVNLVIPRLGRESLGSYTAEFHTQNNGISASVEDSDGVIDLAGSLQVNNDRSYEFIAQLVTIPNTPQSLRQQLKFLPPPNERGQQEIRLEGIL